MIFKFLANNLAIMLAMGLFYGLLIRKKPQRHIHYWQIVSGIFFGFAAIVTMQNSYVLRPGVIFDCRSVILSVTGMFAGPITALVSVLIASAYRIWQGGVGTLTGVLVIISTAGVGVVFYYLRQSRPSLNKPLYLYVFGVLVHGVMLLLMLTFPWDIAVQIYKNISLPVIILFPVGTALLGKVFADQEDRFNAEENIKKYNQNLQDSKKRLQLAVQSGNIGLYDWNIQTNEVFYSPQWKHQIGYDDHEIGNTFEEWEKRVHPEDIEKTLEIIQTCLKAPPPGAYQAEFRLRHKDGSYRWIIAQGELLYGKDEKPFQMVGAHIDITDRKKAEEELEDSARQYRLLFTKMVNGSVLFEVLYDNNGKPCDFRYLMVNPAFEKLTGLAEKDVIGKRLLEVLPRTEPDWIEEMGSISRKGESGHFEKYHEQTGKYYDVTEYCPEEGKITLVFNDITERKQAEEARQKFVMLADSSSEFIGMCDLDLNPIYVNLAGIRMVGLPDLAAACRVKVQDYFFPEDQRFIAEEFFPRVLREGEGHVEIRLRHFQTGEPIWMYYYLFSVRNAGGEVVGWATVSRDITERRQAEETLRASELKLRASNQQLRASEQQLIASNRQLRANETQLNNLMRILESKNKELQDIVYVSSHDLKSPLVNINGFSGFLKNHCCQLQELLNNEVLPETIRDTAGILLRQDIPEDLAFITQSAEKMRTLIDGLLKVSRIGAATVTKTKLNLNEIMNNIIKTAAFKIQEKEAIVTVDDLPDCFGDANQIDQVFSNLVDNALKYADPSRKLRIHISGQSQDTHTVYCVQDNGIGITPAYHQKVFEVFHRLNPSDTAGGCGLGLTVIRRIMDVHDGQVWLESTLGEGCKFFISLPNK